MKFIAKNSVVVILLLMSILGFGQSKVEWVFNGDEFFKLEDYPSALKYYKRALNDTIHLQMEVIPYESVVSNQKIDKKTIEIDSVKVPLEDYVNHQIGYSYYAIKDYTNAEKHYELIATDSSYFPDDYFYYGAALMNNEKYKEAITSFEKFVKSNTKSDSLLRKAQWSMSGCINAMRAKVKEEVIVTLADTSVFNKGTSSFGAMYWQHDGKLLFSSAREGGVIIDPENQQSEYLLDLYWTEKIDSTTWGKANNFGRPLNSAKHDAAGCFNNGDVLFYTRMSDEDRTIENIHLARMVNLRFYESFKLDSSVNFPGYKSAHPFITMDGTTMFFSSNRPGGKGGMDIWKIAIDELGNPVGEPENLGEPINTEFDEVTPFFHETTSTLFFSSEGHKSMGGLDIFKSSYNRDEDWYAKPVNLGKPINSSKDDAYMIWDSFMKHGWFSSDREPCEGGHCYDIYEVKNAPIKIYIEGLVLDAFTDDIIPNATITFKDVEYKFEPFVIQADEDGFYETELNQNIEVFMKCQKQGYFADAASANTKSITETTTITQDFFLRKIPEGEIEIEGIEYDYNSATLRPESKVILDELFNFLELNNNIEIEISSHTDSRGSDSYNQTLSQQRAKSCVDYLIEKGIDPKRIVAKGYGETKPAYLLDENKEPILDKDGNKIQLTEAYINSQSTKKKREELHQKNRRTAFRVLGEGYDIKSR